MALHIHILRLALTSGIFMRGGVSALAFPADNESDPSVRGNAARLRQFGKLAGI